MLIRAARESEHGGLIQYCVLSLWCRLSTAWVTQIRRVRDTDYRQVHTSIVPDRAMYTSNKYRSFKYALLQRHTGKQFVKPS